MYRTKKRITSIFFGIILVISLSTSSVSANENKSGLLARIDRISTDATDRISTDRQRLLDRASGLGDLYDTRLRIAGFESEDIVGLMRIGAFSFSGSFRDQIMQDYRSLDDALFADAKTQLASLSTLRLDISLGTSDITDGQRIVYSGSIDTIEHILTTAQEGVDTRIAQFENDGKTLLDARLAEIVRTSEKKKSTLDTLRAIRNDYGMIETGLVTLTRLLSEVDNNVLQSLQNNLSFLDTEKIGYRTQLGNALSGAIANAKEQSSRIREKSAELDTFRDMFLREWDDRMDRDFRDDRDLLLSFAKAQNIIKFERDLRTRIYDASGSIDYSSVSVSGGLMDNIRLLRQDIDSSTGSLSSLLLRYANERATGTDSQAVRTILTSRLRDAYREATTDAETRLRTLLTQMLANASLEETNAVLSSTKDRLTQANAQLTKQARRLASERSTLDRAVLTALRTEWKNFQSTLRKSLSLSFAKTETESFIRTVNTLAGSGSANVLATAERLRYNALAKYYERSVVRGYTGKNITNDRKTAKLTITELLKETATEEEKRVVLTSRLIANQKQLSKKLSKTQRYILLTESREICLRLAKR